MYIAMNRFRIKPGHEQDFIDIWKNRDSHLESVPGFISFNLLQGETKEDHTLMSSHAVWQDKAAFEGWLKSDAFKKAHANAGTRRDIYLGPPQFEGFETVL
ncbi:antibiotic biosynthesis monooxygenase family protein [Amphritea pacifica]|uniref:Antibiotic biosynthesis monooxygenase n=1 Tax=Amphritea pacifica TaxID=2811233 RepID=A0ABS2W527_9GAMM|nr:antibiotic biosynthesis monooxygenase [Amphritea pacifica]MBN0986607.1 antibiotic biosynthesis monooxygenase [Amphritea pacifica]MBN1007201.1 antibiotic biosynthesis monooxygenase [Amphritea pacifica]